jgi:hypothetical protein
VLNEKLIIFALHQILLPTVVSVLTFLASVNQGVGMESVSQMLKHMINDCWQMEHMVLWTPNRGWEFFKLLACM